MLPVGIGINQVPLMNQDKDVVVDIFSRLPVWSVGACSLVCKDWNQLLESEYYSKKVWQRVACCQFRFIAQKRIDFRSYLRLESNLTNGVYSLKDLPKTTAPIAFKDGQLFSCSLNDCHNIQKWDWKNETCTG